MDLFSSFCATPFQYNKRKSLTVEIGNLQLGGDNPIRVQSMTNTITRNIADTVEQCIRIYEAGGELVRITTPTVQDVGYVAEIRNELHKRGYSFPLVTDVHFSPKVAEAAAEVVEKIRINPGNYSESRFDSAFANNETEWEKHLSQLKERFLQLLQLCKTHHTALRIGVNHGSLSERIMSRYGDTADGMVASAMEFLRICRDEQFRHVVISMKASNVLVMVQAYRLLVSAMNQEGMEYPLHLGVTEAGEGEDGRIKSAVGIGTLLSDGIGDTIRVSLTEDPEKEIPVAQKLVSYFQDRGNTILPTLPSQFKVDPFNYSRRESSSILNLGGKQVPAVLASVAKVPEFRESLQNIGWKYNVSDRTFEFGDLAADILFMEEIPQDFSVPKEKLLIVPYRIWKQQVTPSNVYPIINTDELKGLNLPSTPVFINISIEGLLQNTLKVLPNMVLVLESSSGNAVAELRAGFAWLQEKGMTNPVILKKRYKENQGEDLQLKASSDLGALLVDGLGDGIWIENPLPVKIKEINTLSFGILQATRTRISKTEYISCPSCGRTLFDLQTTSAKIRERTHHLKGLKIGIMGCIVNGPGEMADAHYGYVGAGPGRITLYKNKEVVRKNLPEAEAVDALIELIKMNGDWVDPN